MFKLKDTLTNSYSLPSLRLQYNKSPPPKKKLNKINVIFDELRKKEKNNFFSWKFSHGFLNLLKDWMDEGGGRVCGT